MIVPRGSYQHYNIIKSTIFKQMRLLYGTERSDDDLRMYGVVACSNIVVAVRKLCSHLRNLGLEEELDRESRENKDLEDGEHSSMNCRQAYDELMASYETTQRRLREQY